MANKPKVKLPTVKTKNHMNANAEWKWIIAPILIVLLGSILIYYQWLGERASTPKNIEYIRGFMTSSGKLNDYSNKLSMHDPTTDIQWYWNEDGSIELMFGRILLDWESVEEFLSEPTQESLNSIGFVVDYFVDKKDTDKDGNREELIINVYWKDTYIQRWVH